eukprot:UN18986
MDYLDFRIYGLLDYFGLFVKINPIIHTVLCPNVGFELHIDYKTCCNKL